MYGEEINNRIKELKLKDTDIARYVGVSPTEINKIKNDERSLLRKDIFLKLMACLDLNPLDFGGFARLDFKSKDDFYNGEEFIKSIKSYINSNPNITARQLANYLGVSEVQISRLLSQTRTTIPIDQFALLCNFFGLNYQDFLVDKTIIPSSSNQSLAQQQLLAIASTLTHEQLQSLIDYANLLANNEKSSVSGKTKVLTKKPIIKKNYKLKLKNIT